MIVVLDLLGTSGSSSVGVVHTINAPGDSGAQGEIVLQTNSAERLRINSVGNIGINTTNPRTLLFVNNGAGTRVTNAAKTNVVELTTDGNVEIKRTGGGAFIDFADSTSQDHDARIQHNSGLDFSNSYSWGQ